MRTALWLLMLAVACGGRNAVTPVVTSGPADGGSGQSGPPAPDAGSDSDAGSGQDAGTSPSTIGAVPCPGTPQLLWSRTLSLDANFRGATDSDGNLYWTEYDPYTGYPPPAAAGWLVSANADGQVRYRVKAPTASYEGAFLVAAGRVVMSRNAVVAAYAAATGAPLWTIDLTSSDPNSGLLGIADLGNGTLAFALYSSTVSPLYLVTLATGAITRVGSSDVGYQVLGADGAGSMLARSSSYPSPAAADLSVIDSAGRVEWTSQITGDPPSLLAWAGQPWLSISGASGISSKGRYQAAPTSWFATTMGSDLGFTLVSGATALTPIGVLAIRGGTVVAGGSLPGTRSYDSLMTWPFLADDHLVLLAQPWYGNAGLCFPMRPGQAFLSRIDIALSSQCPLAFQEESGIEGAALQPGRLVIGRRAFVGACSSTPEPVTIEAYALPGESLAKSGWVQRGGSPGLGMRPIPP